MVEVFAAFLSLSSKHFSQKNFLSSWAALNSPFNWFWIPSFNPSIYQKKIELKNTYCMCTNSSNFKITSLVIFFLIFLTTRRLAWETLRLNWKKISQSTWAPNWQNSEMAEPNQWKGRCCSIPKLKPLKIGHQREVVNGRVTRRVTNPREGSRTKINSVIKSWHIILEIFWCTLW